MPVIGANVGVDHTGIGWLNRLTLVGGVLSCAVLLEVDLCCMHASCQNLCPCCICVTLIVLACAPVLCVAVHPPVHT